MSRVLLFCSFLFVEAHGSFVSYNRTYGSYTYILPLQSSTYDKGQVTYSPRIIDSSGAQIWCSSHFDGSKLATITSETIQKNINGFIAGAKQELKHSNLEDVRVGGKSQNGWRWINGKVLKGYDVSESSQHKGPYGALSESTKRFDSRDHNVRLSYICQYSTNVRTNCHVNESGRCYVVTNASVNWLRARSDCIRQGGDLASLDIFKDNKKMDAFVQNLRPVSGYHYWIGLRKETFWRWDENGQEMNYTNWRFDQTASKGQCLALFYPNSEYERKGKWSATNCSDPLPFICEIHTALVTTTDVTGSYAASCQATTVALSICLTISMIVAVALAVILIMKHHIRRAEASCPTIHDNKHISAAASKTGSKQTPGSKNNNNKQDIYANCAKDKSSAKPSANAASGPQSTTKNSYVDDQQQQSTIYASVQDQGGSSGPRVKEDVTSSAAATDSGRLIYAEVEFSKQPTK